MIVLSTLSNYKVWGTDRLHSYSGDENIDKIGSVYSVSGIEGLSNKIISGDANDDLYSAVKANPKKFGLPEEVDYPIIVSFTAGDSDLSIQVHPTDPFARENENKLIGKSEAWYFIEKPNKSWIYAESKIKDKQEIKDKILNGKFEDVVGNVEVKEGDIAFIEAGTIHALTEGSLVYEIQQSTDITYRFYDYDRTDKDGNKRELHLDKALGTIVYENKVDVQEFGLDKTYKYKPFDLLRCKLENTYKNDKDVAVAITVIKGNLQVDGFAINQGMSILVLPEEEIKIEKPCEEVIIATPNLYFCK